MELIEYLTKHGLNRLTEEYFIKVKRHTVYPNLFLLSYDFLNSPLSEKVVQQCRGIILDEDKNWSIISYPFDKFFNYGEPNAATIDWSTAKVYEKLDGSLVVLYFNNYSSKWEVSTSGTPDAEGVIKSYKSLTFNKLFWQTWNSLGYQLPEDVDCCFMFELLTPYNIVIVRPKVSAIVLHGVRNLPSLKEDNPEIFAAKYDWECVQRFDLSSWEDVLAASSNLEPLASEGYIVCDDKFNRVKVKSPEYVALAHTKGGLSDRRLLEIIVNAEGDEVLSYFPEWLPIYQNIQAKYEALVEEIVENYQAIASISATPKEFATLAIQHTYSGILFGLRSGKLTSVKAGLKSMPFAKVEALIQLDFIAIIN